MFEDHQSLARVAPAEVLHVLDDLAEYVLVGLAEVEFPRLGAGRGPLNTAGKRRSHYQFVFWSRAAANMFSAPEITMTTNHVTSRARIHGARAEGETGRGKNENRKL